MFLSPGPLNNHPYHFVPFSEKLFDFYPMPDGPFICNRTKPKCVLRTTCIIRPRTNSRNGWCPVERQYLLGASIVVSHEKKTPQNPPRQHYPIYDDVGQNQHDQLTFKLCIDIDVCHHIDATEASDEWRRHPFVARKRSKESPVVSPAKESKHVECLR